jgi:SAM-dependent methyltransferase
MPADEASPFDRMAARYARGDVPWDEPLPPPELIRLLEKLPPGRALDLGCGFGRAAIYMARLGWEVDGVDFVPQALATAADRARAAGLSIRFHVASVTDLGFLADGYDLALDVGCGHALNEGEWRSYHAHLRRLLRPGGTFLLFARVWSEGDAEEDGRRGLDPDRLRNLFADGFTLAALEEGRTAMVAQPPWPSAWFRFRRT